MIVVHVVLAVLSVVITIIVFRFLSRKVDREQLGYMQSDGLTDDEIVEIMGEEWFNRVDKRKI